MEKKVEGMEGMLKQMEDVEKEIGTSRRSRLRLHAANLLRKSLEKVMAIRGIDMPQGENDPKHGRYAQAAKLLKRESWESDTNLPVKYWKALQDLPAVSMNLDTSTPKRN